ncbi:MAG TPA: DUF72 domain-containing protein [Candidatus Limnocylindrales bacterium]|nr:DUF72 domain-containing protein [Candidatus Limnocylindrales bacterium]
MKTHLYIGTSGWHYNHWLGLFYPPEITGYNELRYHAEHFNTVENNSSFYRIASEATYKTWSRMTPENYKFSMKLNKLITHVHRLELNKEVKEKVCYILTSTQVLQNKLGVILIQLPPSFKYDLERLDKFLSFLKNEIKSLEYKFDVAIEFRNKYWFIKEVYAILKKYNVALVASQSSRYPEVRQVTADFAYIRMHGPVKLFSSPYTAEQLEDWAAYIKSISKKMKQIFVYFNNDFHGFALENAKELSAILNFKITQSKSNIQNSHREAK